MKTISLNFLTVPIMLIGVLFLSQCKKPPVADFSYAPTSNPEAGDTIFFTNLSLDAITYSWDFGDGDNSAAMDPFKIYAQSGNYNVTLTAMNSDGENAITKPVTVNAPTVLGLQVYYDDEITVIPEADVFVYDNESDWNNYEEPQFLETTDDEGIALFQNLEAQVYYIDIFKESAGGVWYAGGSTEVLNLNEINGYGVACQFYPDNKKSLDRGRLEDTMSAFLSSQDLR